MLIKCYTDGSACVKGVNAGKGGFATYFPNLMNERKAFSLGFENTKTGRMEITALLYSIRALPLKLECTLKVFSDSEYVVKSFTEKRLEKWVSNNWKTFDYKGNEIDVKNIDLWKQVLFEISKRPFMKLVLQHIKAHKLDKEKNKNKLKELLQEPNIIGNFVADNLANYKRFNNYKIDLR